MRGSVGSLREGIKVWLPYQGDIYTAVVDRVTDRKVKVLFCNGEKIVEIWTEIDRIIPVDY